MIRRIAFLKDIFEKKKFVKLKFRSSYNFFLFLFSSKLTLITKRIFIYWEKIKVALSSDIPDKIGG